MNSIQKAMSDKFWATHFSNLLDTPLDESYALKINFWDNLKTALETTDEDTVKAVMLSIPAIKITTADIYTRIVQTAKRIWDNKRHPMDEIIARRQKELGIEPQN